MLLHTFPSGPFGTNAYIIACPRTREAAIIDPAPESFHTLTSFIEKHQLKPKALLLTHSHWDHIADAAAIRDKYDLPVYIHPLDTKNLEKPGSDGLPCWIHIDPVTPTNLIEEGDAISIGDLKFQVIHTPGHTPGGVCFYCPEEKTLISGDTLFKGSIGNLSFATARPSLMWPSLAKLALLPPDTKVYPGHGESTTIGNERWLDRAEKIFGSDDLD
jgi:glyoxylase-like metal-dependent hydrolase (beta-lactamase superfamily II)